MYISRLCQAYLYVLRYEHIPASMKILYWHHLDRVQQSLSYSQLTLRYADSFYYDY